MQTQVIVPEISYEMEATCALLLLFSENNFNFQDVQRSLTLLTC